MPRIDYADAGGVSIAYQIVGHTGRTVVGIPGFVQNIELLWDEPHAHRFFEQMASFATLVHFDKRGTGLSDRELSHPTLEERADELLAVMDAAGVERAVLAGFSEGSTLAAFVAATHPARVEGLMLAGGMASFVQRDDHPWAPTATQAYETFNLCKSVWGEGTVSADFYAPSMAHDDAFRVWAGRYERQSINPSRIQDYAKYVVELDIRHLLPTINVPTVVFHAQGDRIIPVASGRYLADHIPGASFIEVDGCDHALWYGNKDAWLDAIAKFLTGNHAAVDVDRELATVLFTDIVASTASASVAGDAAWRDTLDRHDRVAEEVVTRHRGRIVKSTGDGLLATFDGPSRAVQASIELVARAKAELGLTLRAGLHCGEIERRGGDIAGIAVHLAARVEAEAPAGGVTISGTVKDLLAGSSFSFSDRGDHNLKGIEGTWRLFDVVLTR